MSVIYKTNKQNRIKSRKSRKSRKSEQSNSRYKRTFRKSDKSKPTWKSKKNLLGNISSNEFKRIKMASSNISDETYYK